MLMKTQMFTKFIEERSFVSDTNASLAFFDECVDKAVMADAAGAEHHFLELESVGSDRTVFILPPDNSGLPKGKQRYKQNLTLT